MKKYTHLLAMAVFAAFVLVACHKDRPEVTQVVNVTLAPNQSYNYTVPVSGDKDDVMQITQEAVHAALINLNLDAKGQGVLNYTPAKDYSGTDEIHVSTVEGPHQGHGGGQSHGNCSGHHHDGGTTYIFKITIGTTSNPG